MLTLSVLPIAVTVALYVFVIGFFVDAIRGAVLGSALGLGLDPGGAPITVLGIGLLAGLAFLRRHRWSAVGWAPA